MQYVQYSVHDGFPLNYVSFLTKPLALIGGFFFLKHVWQMHGLWCGFMLTQLLLQLTDSNLAHFKPTHTYLNQTHICLKLQIQHSSQHCCISYLCCEVSGLGLSWGFSGFSLYLSVMVLPCGLWQWTACPRGPGSTRTTDSTRKLDRQRLMTGRLGWRHPHFPPVSGEFWKRVEGRGKTQGRGEKKGGSWRGSVKRGWWKDKNEEKEREMKRKRPLI